MLNFSDGTKTIYLYFITFLHIDMTQATQRVRASATMILAMLNRIESVPARYGLVNHPCCPLGAATITSGPLFSKKNTPSCGYRNPNYKHKTDWRQSYINNGNTNTNTTVSSYWRGALDPDSIHTWPAAFCRQWSDQPTVAAWRLLTVTSSQGHMNHVISIMPLQSLTFGHG